MSFVTPSRITLTIVTIGVALLAVLWSRCPVCSSACTSSDTEPSHQGYFEYECAGKPHHSSWSSWYHPQWMWKSKDLSHSTHTYRAGAVTKDWSVIHANLYIIIGTDILYHLGGNGPWVEKVIDVVEGGIGAPDGCEVDQVHMMARHAERYPTKRVGQRVRALVERMRKSKILFKEELSFFNDWELFWSDDAQIEQLTSTGPFSGTLGSFTTGVRLRTRYLHLLSKALSQRTSVKFWASDCQRVIDTARYFGAGFFGLDWQQTATLEVISEDSSLGANTLTPGDTCLTYVEDEEEGHDKGYTMLWRFRETYLTAIRERLQKHNPDFSFTVDEIYAAQEMCGFETTVRGSSSWCDVFTQEEFLSFEYARDLLHYYRAGPGTKYGALMGWLWLNATTNLLVEGSRAGPLFFSFVHDGDIAPMVTALDIINDAEHLPTTHVQHNRKWRKSQVSPMGGRIIFELLSCKSKDENSVADKFVRININDGITVIPGCDKGPGKSCPLEDFAARTKRKGVEVGDFREKCGLKEDAADRITFLHQ